MIFELEAAIQAERRLRELKTRVREARLELQRFQQIYSQSLKTLYSVLDDPNDMNLVHIVEGEAWLMNAHEWEDDDGVQITLTPVQMTRKASDQELRSEGK